MEHLPEIALEHSSGTIIETVLGQQVAKRHPWPENLTMFFRIKNWPQNEILKFFAQATFEKLLKEVQNLGWNNYMKNYFWISLDCKLYKSYTFDSNHCHLLWLNFWRGKLKIDHELTSKQYKNAKKTKFLIIGSGFSGLCCGNFFKLMELDLLLLKRDLQ